MSMVFPFTFRSLEAGVATINTFVSIDVTTGEPHTLDSPFIAATSGPISLIWKNTGDDTITYRVLGTNVVLSAAEEVIAVPTLSKVVSTADILSGAVAAVEIQDAFWQFYYFQAKAKVGDAQGTSLIHGRHGRL